MNEKQIKRFETRVRKTIKKYKLVNKKDRIIVACSGGKDSTTTLYLLKKFGYNIEAIIIDLLIGDWSKRNLENIKQFCKDQKIKLHVVNMRKEFGSSICYIRSGIQSKSKLKNCTICGVIKKWLLNRKARELKATKLAVGINLDDEAETVLMNIFMGSPKLGLGTGPKTGVIEDKRFVQRIKPLFFLKNEEIREYSKAMNFPVLYEPCPCSEGSFRRDVRKHLVMLEKENSNVKMDIVKNFMKVLPALRKRYENKKELRYCDNCGEPSRNAICKRCDLIKILKE